jgi:hypothetical protein
MTRYSAVGAHIAMYVVSADAYFASTTAALETGAVISDSMVPLRRSSAKRRIVIAGTSRKSTRYRSTVLPKKACTGV